MNFRNAMLQTDRQHSIESNIYSSGLNVHVLGSQKRQNIQKYVFGKQAERVNSGTNEILL